MTKKELKEMVKNYKKWINCEENKHTNLSSYPSNLEETERGILHWCSTQCLDVEEYGLRCPCKECPLNDFYNSFF